MHPCKELNLVADVLKEWTSNPEPQKPNTRWDFWPSLTRDVLSLHPVKPETPVGAVVPRTLPKGDGCPAQESQASPQLCVEMGDPPFFSLALSSWWSALAEDQFWLELLDVCSYPRIQCLHMNPMKKEAPCEESTVLSLFSPPPRHHVAVSGCTDIALQCLPAPDATLNQPLTSSSTQPADRATLLPMLTGWVILAMFSVHHH